MKLLAIETATDACSAALLSNVEIIERYELAPRRHTQLILPMVQSLLLESGFSLTQLDAIAFGRGPGAFTGLRNAASVAQGLAFGADLPVIPVSTLAALAQGCDGDKVIAGFDARMSEVYIGAFQRDANGIVVAVTDEQVCSPDAASPVSGKGWTGVGSAWSACPDLQNRFTGQLQCMESDAYPRAADVAKLAQQLAPVAVEQGLPVYLRDQVAIAKPKPQIGRL